MTRKDIELLFKNESYNEAMELLRKELQDDSENAEWFYYLFLAENKDYANINLDDVICEFNFNRALDFANTRLRESFQAEYNFYKAVDPALRKYFSYASRGNIEKFEQLLNSYGYKTTELIHDSSSTKDFYSNLDYLVTSRVKHDIVDLNILSLNLLYLSTHNKKVLEIYNVLKERAEEIGTTLANAPLANNLLEIKEYMNTIKANINISKEEEKKRLELEALAKSLEKEKENLNKREEKLLEAKALLNSKEYELKRQKEIEVNKKAFFQEPETIENKPIQDTPIKKEVSNEKKDYFKIGEYSVCYLSIALFIITYIISIIDIVVSVVSNLLHGSPLLIVLSVIVFALSILLFYRTLLALKRQNQKNNEVYSSLIFNLLSMLFAIFGIIFCVIGIVQHGV